MPTYEYRCRDCGHAFDAYQAFTDDPLTECPECDGSVRKVFGNVGITFKGSGFYKTDSRSGSGAGSGSGNGSSGGDESSKSSSSGGSTDASGSGSSSSGSDAKATSGSTTSSGG